MIHSFCRKETELGEITVNPFSREGGNEELGTCRGERNSPPHSQTEEEYDGLGAPRGRTLQTEGDEQLGAIRRGGKSPQHIQIEDELSRLNEERISPTNSEDYDELSNWREEENSPSHSQDSEEDYEEIGRLREESDMIPRAQEEYQEVGAGERSLSHANDEGQLQSTLPSNPATEPDNLQYDYITRPALLAKQRGKRSDDGVASGFEYTKCAAYNVTRENDEDEPLYI